MGLVFFCTWIIGGLGGGVQNHLECLSNIIHPANPLYHFICPQFISHSPPPLPSPLSGKEQTRSFCDNQYSLASYFLYYFQKNVCYNNFWSWKLILKDRHFNDTNIATCLQIIVKGKHNDWILCKPSKCKF